MIPNPTVTYSSPNATGALVFTPAVNASGTATITVVVQDNGGTASGGQNTTTETFVVTVTPVNQPPTLNFIPNPSVVAVGAGQQTINLSGISIGPGNAATASATTSQQHGQRDHGHQRRQRLLEPQSAVGHDLGWQRQRRDGQRRREQCRRGHRNQCPNPGSGYTAVPTVTIGAGQTLTITATSTSSNANLIPSTGTGALAVIYTPGSTTGTLTFTPTPGQSGTATITVTLTNSGSRQQYLLAKLHGDGRHC